VVIGVGTAAAIPAIDGLAGTPYWTNREAVETDTLPASLLVLGGGPVGLELAQAFARFGVRVSVAETLDRLIAGEEPESSAVVAEALAADGIDVHTSVTIEEIGYAHGEFQLGLADGTTLRAEKLLVSTGRRAELEELGLETAGLDPGARFIEVDERMRAGDRLWAVGDVTGHGGFTHVAMYQAGIAVRDILGQAGPPADYRALPRVTFTDPEIGSVGMTERPGWPYGSGSPGCPTRPGAGSTRRATRASSSWSSTPAAGCWSGRPRRDRPVGRCSPRSRSPFRARCRWTGCGT
jgi:pyruvate/2-oxoglutarate dehydrogenase complex dihydrolipoamide dehydrogenase (E3) component